MNTQTTHIIHSVVVDVNVSSLTQAENLRDNVGAWVNDIVMRKLETFISSHGLDTREYSIQLDQLELNLDFDQSQLSEIELEESIGAQLEKKLLPKINAVKAGASSSEANTKIDQNQTRIKSSFQMDGTLSHETISTQESRTNASAQKREGAQQSLSDDSGLFGHALISAGEKKTRSILYFIEHGLRPWWISDNAEMEEILSPESLLALLRDEQVSHGFIAQLSKLIERTNIQKRIIQQFDDKCLIELILGLKHPDQPKAYNAQLSAEILPEVRQVLKSISNEKRLTFWWVILKEIVHSKQSSLNQQLAIQVIDQIINLSNKRIDVNNFQIDTPEVALHLFFNHLHENSSTTRSKAQNLKRIQSFWRTYAEAKFEAATRLQNPPSDSKSLDQSSEHYEETRLSNTETYDSTQAINSSQTLSEDSSLNHQTTSSESNHEKAITPDSNHSNLHEELNESETSIANSSREGIEQNNSAEALSPKEREQTQSLNKQLEDTVDTTDNSKQLFSSKDLVDNSKQSKGEHPTESADHSKKDALSEVNSEKKLDQLNEPLLNENSSAEPTLEKSSETNSKDAKHDSIEETSNQQSNAEHADHKIKDQFELYRKAQESHDELKKEIEHSSNSEKTVLDNLICENAGLIILHPFLKHFFKKIELLNEDNTIKYPELAVHLLHFIATGKTEVPESSLTFEKFLCGLPISQSIPRSVEIADEMKTEVSGLLEAALDQWKALKSNSKELLRNEFLIRPGKLILEDQNPRAIIERKTADILLDRLPWNISIIRLPWIEQLIYVEW